MSNDNTQYLSFSTDAATLKRIADAVQEICDSKTRIAGEKDFIKDAIASLHEEVGIQKDEIRYLVDSHFKQSNEEKVEKITTLAEIYELVFK